MRELIFRAIHKEKLDMYWFDVLWGNRYNSGSGYICMLPMDVPNVIHQAFRADNRIDVDPDDCIIQQFTGLLDKSGTRIFEGDVCNFYHYSNKITGIGAVYWSKDGAYFGAKVNGLPFLLHQSKETEVIGHIYQPEFAHLRATPEK